MNSHKCSFILAYTYTQFPQNPWLIAFPTGRLHCMTPTRRLEGTDQVMVANLGSVACELEDSIRMLRLSVTKGIMEDNHLSSLAARLP